MSETLKIFLKVIYTMKHRISTLWRQQSSRLRLIVLVTDHQKIKYNFFIVLIVTRGCTSSSLDPMREYWENPSEENKESIRKL
jgi:hypothetical protein